MAEDKLALVDLRSPGEFARGSMPYAKNIPLFTDAERHEVGILYKSEGRLPAIQRGLEIFAAKAAAFIDEVAALANAERRIALHCWRGGMRSGAVAKLLTALGYGVHVLDGGYKAYRQEVLQTLEHFAKHPLLVLHGRTGAGKTKLLRQLPAGFPKVDFEGIAQHRGSAFGGLNQPVASPTQQNFENLLVQAYRSVMHHPVVLVEIENNIGPVSLPPGLRKNVAGSPMVLVTREFADRVEIIHEQYAEGWNRQHQREFFSSLAMMRRFLSREQFESIGLQVNRGNLRQAIQELLQLRYDKVYDKSIDRNRQRMIAEFNLTNAESAAVGFISDYCQFHERDV